MLNSIMNIVFFFLKPINKNLNIKSSMQNMRTNEWKTKYYDHSRFERGMQGWFNMRKSESGQLQ